MRRWRGINPLIEVVALVLRRSEWISFMTEEYIRGRVCGGIRFAQLERLFARMLRYLQILL
jgi:hypothetical protein